MRRVFVLAGLVGLAFLGFSAPKIRVEPELYDFGTAVDGDVVEFFAAITNTGSQVLRIDRVLYNCVCTSYELPKRELAPNETVRMKIRFNTRGYSSYAQPVSQTLTLYTNDPARPQVVITVRGTVRALSPHEAPAASLYQTLFLLLDVRSPSEFQRVHILGALNVPLSELEAWAERLPKTHVIYVYDETGEKSAQAVALLQRKGFMLVRAIRGGLAGWWQELGDLFLVWGEGVSPSAPVGQPYAATAFTELPSRVARSFVVVVDVRRPEEFRSGHLAGALNVPLFTQAELVNWAKSLPAPRPGYSLQIWIVDKDGTKACSIAGYLRAQGYSEARCLFGGMQAWTSQYGSELVWVEP